MLLIVGLASFLVGLGILPALDAVQEKSLPDCKAVFYNELNSRQLYDKPLVNYIESEIGEVISVSNVSPTKAIGVGLMSEAVAKQASSSKGINRILTQQCTLFGKSGFVVDVVEMEAKPIYLPGAPL